MINSHLLYRLSYRGISIFQPLLRQYLSGFAVSEVRHFTEVETDVNT